MHTPLITNASLERFQGCILGLAVGDATGAPLEGVPAEVIWYDFGGAAKFVSDPPVEVLCCTDDTHMSIGVAQTLVAKGRIEEVTLCEQFAAHYDPSRGYDPGARRIIEAIRRGATDWRQLAESVFPGGSLGNGAAMRVAPIGLFFHDDLHRVADEATLSALPTHVHPVGIDGARIMAIATALALTSAGLPFGRKAFFDVLISFAATEEFRSQLETAASLPLDASIAPLGHGLEAHRSVVTAIAAFATNPDDYSAAISRAIGLGGDTDTLAAMAGALAGARLGVSAMPRHLMDRLEEGLLGRSFLLHLGEALFKAHRDLDWKSD